MADQRNVETFDPTAGVLIVIDLMLDSAPIALCCPVLEEEVFVKNVPVILRPFPERFATGAVNGAETT